jgi:ankyrin repeat protein
VRSKAKPPPRRINPVHRAALIDDIESLIRLLREGADPNDVGRDGMTPLHFAAHGYSCRAAWALIESGAQVDKTDRHGRTPLWMAVYGGKKGGEMIRLLRKSGADPYLRIEKGVPSPLELARQIADIDVKQYFADLP